jgi:hypothetical protein
MWNKAQNNFKPAWLFLGMIAAGIAARLLVATLGHDFDFDSWQIVANLAGHGDNVYAGTDRYNFAPGWFNILHALDLLSGHNSTVFRYLVAGFLGLGDVGIFIILWRCYGKLAACFFLLNPISIIVSGYQNNFDNLAILLGMVAVMLMGDDFEKPLDRRKFLGLFVLGLSLVVKHVFFAFPFWLAVKQKGLLQKLVVILVPVLMFFLSFLPWWHGGSQGIIQNVFLYRSFTNEYFYNLFVPQFVQFMFGSQAEWFFLVALFAFVYRKKNTMEFLLFYTCVMVAFAPSSVNEYLAIPGAFVAAHLNLLTILYTVVGTCHMLVSVNGLHLSTHFGLSYIDIAIFLLCLGLIWTTWGQYIAIWSRKFLDWCISEVKNQIHPEK